MKLEVVVIPVSDVDRAKRFYGGLGWRLDADFVVGDAFRAVQFTPPGSPCSIHFGKGITSAAPGSARGLFLVVSDIEAARAELVGRGVDVSEVFHRAGPGKPPSAARIRSGAATPRSPRSSDPDGNGWLLQEVTARLPGRVDADDDDIRLVDRARGRAPACGGRARRAREADRRPARCELAGLVRRVHGRGAGRQAAADMSSGRREANDTVAGSARPAITTTRHARGLRTWTRSRVDAR